MRTAARDLALPLALCAALLASQVDPVPTYATPTAAEQRAPVPADQPLVRSGLVDKCSDTEYVHAETYDLNPATDASRTLMYRVEATASGAVRDPEPFAVITYDDDGAATMVARGVTVAGRDAILARWPRPCDALAFTRPART